MMVARERKVREEPRSVGKDYLKKAGDNYDQMLIAFNGSNWNASATLALQCAISSADAICVQEMGMRSVSQDHLDVCDLVGRLLCEGAGEKAKQLRKIISRKNMVQYECRNMRHSDADEIVKLTTRVYQWVLEAMSA